MLSREPEHPAPAKPKAWGLNRLWGGDITSIPTWSDFLYLAVVLDAWSRRVVGWAMEGHLKTALVLQA